MNSEIMQGEKLKFIKKAKLGFGSNGQVNEIHVIEPLIKGRCVIKTFCPINSKKEVEDIRFLRFIREVETVRYLQTYIPGILKVLDCYLPTKYDVNDPPWYIMPQANDFAKLFVSQRLDIVKKTDYLINLGNTIRQIHDRNYAHRDIKPKNILYNDLNIYLADFGLVWCAEYDGLTNANEKVGPYTFLAPEMQRNADIIQDPKPADVYSFAKIVWCLFRCEIYGFPGAYDRKNSNIVLVNELSIKLLEPIHWMLEAATCDNPANRPHISECLDCLNDFKSCQNENLEIFGKWKRYEIDKQIELEIPPDVVRFDQLPKIIGIIDALKGQYFLSQNPYTSDIRIDGCERFGQGIVIKSEYEGLKMNKYLCFPNSINCKINLDGHKEYILELIKKDYIEDEYNEFDDKDYEKDDKPFTLGETKILINHNVKIQFRSI